MSGQEDRGGSNRTGLGRFPASAIAILGGLFLAGCVTETPKSSPWVKDRLTLYAENEAHGFEPILGSYAVDPALGSDLGNVDRPDPSSLFAPYHKYGRNTYLHNDGSVTLHYYLEPGLGLKLQKLLIGHIKGLKVCAGAPKAVDEVGVMANFITDMRKTSGVVQSTPFMKTQHGTNSATCDLLLVRASSDKLVDVEKYIRKFLIEVPIVEVKIRILEVTLSDNTQYGITGGVTKETSGSPLFRGLTTHFNSDEMIASGGFTLDDLASWFDPARASTNPDYQGGFFVVEGVHDKIRLQAALELLQSTGQAEILSAPKINVLNGHKAVIETGSMVPIPQAKVTLTATSYSYKYMSTGVTMVVLPIVLMDGTLQIQMTSDVTSITGAEQFTTGQGTGSISIPIFSNRGASTIINVKENQAFMLAGLIDRFEIETVNKIPLLGDIPFLGFLFKSKDVDVRRTQVIFYIEPRIIPATETIYGLEE
jgi:type II secretory pathway component GspD/PulD (secretin)